MKDFRKKGWFIGTLPLLLLPAISAQECPNVLIIHTDEQNFRTLGCYREHLASEQAYPWGKDVKVETPNIDYLANNGALFFRCYATSPVSSPSRASFLTGMYPQNANMHTNDMVLSDKTETFAETFRKNGYQTGYFGKLHLNGKGRPEWKPERNFGFSENDYMYNRGHWKKIEDTPEGPQFRPKDDITSTDSITFPTDYFTDKAISFINKNKENPFCCMISLPDPHSANLVRSPYDKLYQHLNFEVPKTARKDTTDSPAWSHGDGLREDRIEDMAQYFGMIKCIDDNVGRIIRALSELNILDNTVIVFTSDHGDMCGQHGLINKSVPLDDSARVPFIVYYPPKIPKQTVINNVVSVIDFTPSLLSFCGIKTEYPYQGRDLSKLWKGEKLPTEYKDEIFMRAPTTTMIESDWDESAISKRWLWVSVVTPEYKLTYSEYPTDKPWFTDLNNDPDELINQYGNPSYKNIISNLAKNLSGYGIKYSDDRVRHPKIAKEINKVITK